jgi:hypothetical protein
MDLLKFDVNDDDDNDEKDEENNLDLFQMIFIRIMEILKNELINDFIEIIFNETKVVNDDTCCDYNNKREINTDWISKYQVKKFLKFIEFCQEKFLKSSRIIGVFVFFEINQFYRLDYI